MKVLDLRNIPCPQNSSKALIFLATLDTGEGVDILVDDGEPIQNVPSALEIENHTIKKIIQAPDKHWIITVLAA